MTVLPFAIGSVVGFVGSMPVMGPVSASIFRDALDRRFERGISVAVGGAIAKGIWATLAIWGFGLVVARHPTLTMGASIVGAVALTVVAVGFFRRPKDSSGDQIRPGAEATGFIYGFAVTLLNPTLLATFSTIAAILHARNLVGSGLVHAIAFGVGIGLGMVLWFSVLLGLMRNLAGRVKPAAVGKIKRTMGCILVAIAVWLVVSAVA